MSGFILNPYTYSYYQTVGDPFTHSSKHSTTQRSITYNANNNNIRFKIQAWHMDMGCRWVSFNYSLRNSEPAWIILENAHLATCVDIDRQQTWLHHQNQRPCLAFRVTPQPFEPIHPSEGYQFQPAHFPDPCQQSKVAVREQRFQPPRHEAESPRKHPC